MISIVNVSKHIRKATVLDNVSLEIPSGRVTALVGPNGSGKTMLMRIVAGLVLPTTGHVEIDGLRLGREADFPSNMGMMLEGPAFLDAYTGFDNLHTLASIRGVANDDQVRKWIAAVGLDPDDKRRYRAYSLGMKQRLGIAGALMEEPRLVLLDEPTNALDVDGVALVQQLIRQARKRGAAILLACHDADVVRAVADEVWHLAEGHLDGHEMLDGGATQ